MTDNTKQFRWILVLYCGITNLYRDRPDVLVARDLLWYPVETDPKKCAAPNVMVVFGRPNGDRCSYRQWEEDGIAPQVALEVLSPGKTYGEMIDKLWFYEDHGVQECYIYSPERNRLEVFLRQQERLERTARVRDWTSPRLGIRFKLTEQNMRVYGPDGRCFMTYEELMALSETAEKARAETAETRAERLAEKLRQRGIDPNGG